MEITTEHYKNWCWTALIIAIIICGGLFAFNQFMEFKYKVQILRGPCQLCVDLNPEVGKCWEMRTRTIEAEKEYYDKNKMNYSSLGDIVFISNASLIPSTP